MAAFVTRCWDARGTLFQATIEAGTEKEAKRRVCDLAQAQGLHPLRFAAEVEGAPKKRRRRRKTR